jgi:hypothetical protein
MYLLLAPLLLSSCAAYYIPTTQNVPLFEEKKQGTAMMALELGQYSSGVDFQGAYSITNHIAVMGSAYLGSVTGELEYVDTDGNTQVYESESRPYRHFEFAAGYFTNIGSTKGIFEVYGGYGSGGTKWDEKELTDIYRYNQFFVQPQVGGHLGKIDLAFSTRLNFANWSRFNQLFLEPGLTFRAGNHKIKFQLQVVTAFDISGQSSDPFSGVGDPNGSSDIVNIISGISVYEVIHTSFGLYIPIGFKPSP